MWNEMGVIVDEKKEKNIVGLVGKGYFCNISNNNKIDFRE